MQGIYTYIPETSHVPKEYNVAVTLSLLFMVPISLAAALTLMYFYISTFRSMCAVPNMAVFCISLTSWFPGMVLTYFLNDSEKGSSRSNYHPSFDIQFSDSWNISRIIWFISIIIIITFILNIICGHRNP
jgi:hypothetical protein